MIQEQNFLEVIQSCDIKIGNYSENCQRLLSELREKKTLSPFTHLNIVVTRNETTQFATTRIKVFYPFKFDIDKWQTKSTDFLSVAREHEEEIEETISNVESKLRFAFLNFRKQTQAVFDVDFSKKYFSQADKSQLVNTTIFAYVSEYELSCELLSDGFAMQPLPPYPPIPLKCKDHAKLENLDYENSGHTGFQRKLEEGPNITIERNGDVDVISARGGGSAEWGEIEGTLTDQTDLNEALANLQLLISNNASAILDINAVIPSQASTENQLADKEFVNSSIATNTANFRGTYHDISELPLSGNTPNDYAFIEVIDAQTLQVVRYDRYKWVANSWEFEYTLNNSSFTASQWAAINSGITAEQVQHQNKPTAYPSVATQVGNTSLRVKSSVGDGGDMLLERGFVYNLVGNPTIDDNKIVSLLGFGDYEDLLDNLTANTDYYIRSFARNSFGLTYGSELTQRTASSRLPSGFQEVEYLQSSGTEYIDIGIGANSTTRWLLDYAWLSANQGQNGTSATGATGRYIIANLDGYLYIGCGNGVTTTKVLSLTTRYAIELNAADGKYSVDGVEYASGLGLSQTTQTMCIFARNVPPVTYQHAGQCYGSQSWNSDTPTRDLVPCYCTEATTGYKGTTSVSVPSGTAGMYDLVEDKFYVNAGAGSFSVGPDVN